MPRLCRDAERVIDDDVPIHRDEHCRPARSGIVVFREHRVHEVELERRSIARPADYPACVEIVRVAWLQREEWATLIVRILAVIHKALAAADNPSGVAAHAPRRP